MTKVKDIKKSISNATETKEWRAIMVVATIVACLVGPSVKSLLI